MSRRLPALTAVEVLRELGRAGWSERRRSGSHLILVHPEKPGRIVVPFHRGTTIKQGTLGSIIDQAGLSRDEFRSLL